MSWREFCTSLGNMKTDTSYLGNDNFLPRLNAVRFFIVLAIALGYASTMPLGPNEHETSEIFGYEPSWIGIQILFFFSGALAYRSLLAGRSGLTYLKSRILRVFPLLLAMTLTTVLVIYPILGKPLSSSQDVLALVKYFFLTVTCLDPGRVLPGLLDDALYMCLIQGAIWTLRWGLILHIGVVIAARVPALLKPRVILSGGLIAMVIYAITSYTAAKLQIEALRTPLVGLRLGYIFLLGMAVWAYRYALPQGWHIRAIMLTGLFGFAALNYFVLPWTSLIEICLSLSLAYGSWLAATSQTRRLSFLSNWPHLALGLYLIIWPTAQVLLHAFPELGRHTLPMVALPLSVVLAWVSYAALTGRINRAIEARLTRKIAVQPTSL